MIRTKGLVHSYRLREAEESPALAGVNARVADGEYVAIIGPNGSGKSTLARHLNGLLQPQAGEVIVGGIDTREEARLWEIRQMVGLVFQNPDNQIVATLVEEDVAFGPENLGIAPGEIRQRVDEALAMVDLDGYQRRFAYALSGGEKQRLAMAGILAMRPRCLVLDEPTSMLDPAGRREVLAALRRLNREEGITVIHITHSMEEAVRADRVLVMNDGQVVLEGTPRQVFAQVEAIRALGLEVPEVTELARVLRADGLDVPADVLTVEEMVTALCPS